MRFWIVVAFLLLLSSSPLCASALAQDTPAAIPDSSLYGMLPTSLAPGVSEGVEVVAISDPVRSTVPVVVKNNSDAEVRVIDIVGVAREADGSLFGATQSSYQAPDRVPSGSIAIAIVYFGTDDLPAGLTYELEPQTAPYDEDATFGERDLDISEVTLRDNEFIGILRNGNAKPIVGTAEVTAICFDAAGSITGYAAAFSEKGDLAPDETTPFSATIYGDGPCDRYLIGATGFRT